MELTELFGPWVNLLDTEETDGLEPCVGVAGEDAAEEAPNSRRVDENRRDGRRRDEEYCKTFQQENVDPGIDDLTFSFHSTTHFSIQGIRLIVTNSRTKRPSC